MKAFLLAVLAVITFAGAAQAQVVGGGRDHAYWSAPASVAVCDPAALRPNGQGNCPPIWSYSQSSWFGQGPAKDSAGLAAGYSSTPYLKKDIMDPAWQAELDRRCPPVGYMTYCKMQIQCPILKSMGIRLPDGLHNAWERAAWPMDAEALYVCLHPSGR